MQFFVFLILYPIIWIISILPFRILYILSDCIFILVYYVFAYRKKTVRENLSLALPHLSEKERLIIEKKFYRHLCDMFLEMAKTMTISKEEIEKRYRFTNLELLQELEKKNKSISLMIGHYASYEWTVSMNYQITYKGFAIYKKLNNPHFDKLVRDIRSKFKATLITTKETRPTMEENIKNNVLGIYGFASDQSPIIHHAYHWRKFMGIEVPVHTGAENFSKKFDMNMLFLKTKKIKRGYYEATFEILSENVQAVPDYQITDNFIDRVEKQIYEAPEFYLWTHKRWKHRR
jgi:Kdo2-lipid IVA lauroyltransferase/acyltransferase